jgi:hypothetical protein
MGFTACLRFNHYINKKGKVYFSKEAPLLHNKFFIIDDSLLITAMTSLPITVLAQIN